MTSRPMRDDFAVFILTHGRADNVKTFSTLAKFKYTGRIYIVIDDEDAQGDAYRARFGDRVLTFSKAAVAAENDEGSNFADRRSVFYARNACWALARQVGARYFMQMDDDYGGFYLRFNAKREYVVSRAECLDAVLTAMVDYFATIPALSIAMSQGGDHIGGDHIGGEKKSGIQKRKAMNTFLCDLERPFKFSGRINEDVNTYIGLGHKGGLFLTIPPIQVNQASTQSQSGGMTEIYLDSGTYTKSFYSILYTPSAVKIGMMKDDRANTAPRIHHRVHWRCAVPQIVREDQRRA
jgi:hypothetical protein